MSIINVLSIDMDYILEPCINLYDDLVSQDNEKKIWDKINEIRNIDKYLSYNEDNLRLIYNLFSKKLMALDDKTKVTFATNHDAILFELTDKAHYGKKFNIYNIDHHHDINYNQEQVKNVDAYDVTSLSNWIWYLDKYNLLNNYSWIRNHNSGIYTGPELCCNYTSIEKPSECDLENQPIDYIFVCNSPQWIPRKYDVFFDMLMDLYTNISGIKTSVEYRVFCEGNRSRPYTQIHD